jgi:hypothetical protein
MQNREITNSVNYTKRIQQSKMATQKYIDQQLKKLRKAE